MRQNVCISALEEGRQEASDHSRLLPSVGKAPASCYQKGIRQYVQQTTCHAQVGLISRCESGSCERIN